MAAAERLVTVVDVEDEVADDRHVSVKARHEAVLTDGRRLLLLDDRGWGSTQPWTTVSAEDVEETTRVVVGPDEPPEGRHVGGNGGRPLELPRPDSPGYGVAVDAQELSQLRHDVVFSERLLTRIGHDPRAAAR